MSRKMVGWIALAVFVVGGLVFGLNSALGSEPPPSGKKASPTHTAPASTSTASNPTLNDAASIAHKLFDAVQKHSGNADTTDGSDNGALSFISDLAKHHDK